MANIKDILINEIANILGITPAEVSSRFTESELEELLNISLCEPESDVTVPFPAINSIPCDDLEVPNLLPPEATDLLDELTNQANKIVDDSQKCVKKVEEVNKVIEEQIDEYNRHKILLEKLIEYQDNYFAVGIYFEERAKEASKILAEFRPIVEEIKNLENQKIDLESKISAVDNEIAANTLFVSPQTSQILSNKKNDLQSKLDAVNVKLQEQQVLLNNEEEKFPIFNNVYFKTVANLLENSSQNSFQVQSYLQQLFSNYISYADISNINDIFKGYSELIECFSRAASINSVQELVQQTYFSFKLEFLNLTSLTISKEIFNKQTGENYKTNLNFPIKGNPLLKKDSFFKSSPIFSLSEYQKPLSILPGGTIYSQYYNLFNDPINNFFSIGERGLTEDISLVDPSLKGTGAETKREAGRTFYVQDLKKLQDFYDTFENRFENRKQEVRARVIDPGQNLIRSALISVARKEVQLALALSSVNRRLPEESNTLKSAIDSINRQNLEFATGLKELNEEIARISKRVEELRPNPTQIKQKLKDASPECFDKIDADEKDCGDTKQKLGSDPLFIKTIKGTDPTLPNSTQLCYWKEFSKIINKIGLLPIPNLKAPPQLRYWPVGLIIPYPGGLIKIPLPIIWIPLIVIATPAGTIVIFLTINGVFISPVVFFVSSSGFKQHILTVKGSSEKFGFSAQDEIFKSGLISPLGLISAVKKAERAVNDANLGKYSQFSETERQKISQISQTLEQSKSIAADSGNATRLLKIARQTKIFQQIISGETPLEITSKALDKGDTPMDAIRKAKKAVRQQLFEVGKPEMRAVNKIKEKIEKKKAELLKKIQSHLENGDTDGANQAREDSKNDGIPLSEKISAITDDMKSFYDKIKFPKIIIPKDASSIDPKPNAIIQAISSIFEYTNINGTQFFTQDNLKVNKIIGISLSKLEPKIKEKSKDIPKKDGKIDIEKNINEVKDFLKDITTDVIDFISGAGEIKDPAKIKDEIKDLSQKLEKESDPVKRKKLQKKIYKANEQLYESYEKQKNKRFIGLTAAVIAAQSELKVDFDPFAPCCVKKTPEIPLDLSSPAALAILAAKEILTAYISSLDANSLKGLLGGRTQVSSNDLIFCFRQIIKSQIPDNISLPIPALTPLSLLKSISGGLLSLFEPRTLNPAAQPQLPSTITIDLNILKAPLLDLLIGFLLSCLPPPSSEGASKNDANQDPSSKNKIGDFPANQQNNSKSKLSNEIVITNCEPNTANDSTLSNGIFSPEEIKKNKQLRQEKINSQILSFEVSNVLVKSSQDIFPSFQTLDTDFLSINPSDLTAIFSSFIELQFDTVESLISPFYNALKLVKGTKGLSLNAIEDIQYKTPPYGPAAFTIFSIYTKIKQNLPASLNYSLIDLELAEAAIQKLEPVLTPIGKVAPIIVAAAGAADSVLPSVRTPVFDEKSKKIISKELKVSVSALRLLHPVLNQDDLPPWERLSSENLLFVIFADEFISNCAEKVGFFRSFV